MSQPLQTVTASAGAFAVIHTMVTKYRDGIDMGRWPKIRAMEDGFGLDDYDIRNIYDDIELPTRATSGSAGYDFKTPIGFILEPGRTIKVPTGIRVKINSGWWLAALPRSGMGFKYRVRPDNTVGVVDEDY